MPTPLPINPIPTPVQKLPVTPLVGDLLVSETVDVKVAVNSTYPDFGTPHPNSVKWPHHKFCWAEPGDKGMQRWVYVADRDNQHLYNWEVDNSAERPTVRQTFLIPRAEFEAGGITYTPPTFIDTEDYVLVATIQGRSDISKLDNLYVTVQVVWEDLSAVLSGQEFDSDTGNIYPYSQEKVPAGTPGTGIDANGTYSEVRPLNSLWSIRTTKQAASLAGSAVPVNPLYPELGSIATRPSYPKIVNYSWPGVLNPYEPYSSFQPPLRSGGYGRAIVTINYWRNPYDGPCLALVLEQWTSIPPNVTTVGSTMFPQSINWDGALLQVSIPPTLHEGILMSETSGTSNPDYKYYVYQQYMPPTVPTDWPEFIDTSLEIRPFFGGYLSRRIRVYNPYSTDFTLIVSLSALTVTDTTITVSWATGATGTASVYIKPAAGAWGSPSATGLSGSDYTFTGLTAATSYEIKVVIGAITSNVVPVTTNLGVPVFTNGPFTATLLEDALMTPIDYDVSGGGLTFSAVGLITGLSINSSTGVVSGTPTPDFNSSTSATITAANSAGSASQVLAQSYTAKPTVSTSQVFSFREGQTGLSFAITATNSANTWSQSTVSSTPDAGSDFFTIQTGMSFNTSTGVISGSATGVDILSRVWVLNITAGNAAGNRGAVPITLNYTAKPTIVLPAPSPGNYTFAYNASSVNIDLDATNTPTSWTYNGTVGRPATAGATDNFLTSLGTTLSFNTSTGVISGGAMSVPSAQRGLWTISVTPANSAGNRGAVNVTINIT